eukprot:m.196989 g.196989  ORF g.196989 m.196989 type:complete len:376 (+) comp15471_c2_seq2:165-1292(+)
MDAVVLEGKGIAVLEHVPRPACTPGHVVVDVKMTGVCGTDIELVDGVLGYFESGLSQYPMVPGHEWVGVIAETSDPEGFPVGRRVVGEVSLGCGACAYCPALYNRCLARTETGVARRDGAFAQFMLFPCASLYVIPDHVPYDMAVLAEPLAVSCHAVSRAELKDGDEVVVFGDGTIGLLILQVCLARGARVHVVGANDFRLETAKDLGATSVHHAAQQTREALIASIKKATLTQTLPRIVFEASGHIEAANTALRSVCPGGRVVLVGLTGGKMASLDVDAVVLEELDITGVVSSLQCHWRDAVAMLAAGRLRSVVTHKFSLREYGKAISLLRRPEGHSLLKIVIDQTADPKQPDPVVVSNLPRVSSHPPMRFRVD